MHGSMTGGFGRPEMIAAPDGVAIAFYDLQPQERAKPALLWAHANGFAAEMYGPFLDLLAGRFRIFAYDVRGHGRSALPPEPFEASLAMARLTEELGAVAAEVRRRIGGAHLVLATHSLSGAPALRFQWQIGTPEWDVLVAVEPAVFPVPGHPLYAAADAARQALSAGARRRRSSWASPAAFLEALAEKPAFKTWDHAMLRAYAWGSLREKAGKWTLRCPGEVEAMFYDAVRDTATFENLGRCRGRICILGGDPAAPTSIWVTRIAPMLAERIPQARFDGLAGLGHMMMFEAPQTCADRILAAAGAP